MKVYFSLLFEKQGADRDSLTEVTYFCVCNACKRVYAYKASDGSGFRDEDACLYVALPIAGTTSSNLNDCFMCCLLPSQQDLHRKHTEACSCILDCNVTCNLRPITITYVINAL